MTVVATLHILISDTIEITSGVSPQLQCSLTKLNATLNIICVANEEFLQNLLSLRYSNLTNVQKEVFNGVLNVIAELRNNDMMAVDIVKTALIEEYQGKKFPPKSDADAICWQGTEKITLKSNDNIIAIREIHQSTDIAHRNGVECIMQKEEQYLRCATCNLSVRERDNFYLHQCKKCMKVKCIYCCSYCKKEFSNDHNKKHTSLGAPKK